MPQRAGPGSRLPRVLGGAKESCTEAWGRQELGPRRDKTVQGPAKHPRASASFTLSSYNLCDESGGLLSLPPSRYGYSYNRPTLFRSAPTPVSFSICSPLTPVLDMFADAIDRAEFVRSHTSR
jgi:hypothetical protein